MRCTNDHKPRRRRKKVSGVMHVGCVCLIALAGGAHSYLSNSLVVRYCSNFNSSKMATDLYKSEAKMTPIGDTWQHHLVVSALKSRLSSPPILPYWQCSWLEDSRLFAFSTQATHPGVHCRVTVAITCLRFCSWLSILQRNCDPGPIN